MRLNNRHAYIEVRPSNLAIRFAGGLLFYHPLEPNVFSNEYMNCTAMRECATILKEKLSLNSAKAQTLVELSEAFGGCRRL